MEMWLTVLPPGLLAALATTATPQIVLALPPQQHQHYLIYIYPGYTSGSLQLWPWQHCRWQLLLTDLCDFSFPPSLLCTSPSPLLMDLPSTFATLNQNLSFFLLLVAFLLLYFGHDAFSAWNKWRIPHSPLSVSLVPTSFPFRFYSPHPTLTHLLLPPLKSSRSLHLFQVLPSPELPYCHHWALPWPVCFTSPCCLSRGGFVVTVQSLVANPVTCHVLL